MESSGVKKRIQQICEELGEDMDSPACKKMHEYIQSCPNCKAFVGSVKKTIELYQVYFSEYSSEQHKKLFKVLHLTEE